MRNKILCLAVLALLVVIDSSASAQLLRPKCTPVAPLVCPPGMPGVETPPVPMIDPNAPNPNPPLPGQNDPLQNAFAQGTEGGGNAGRSFNETFNGDFGGIFVTRQVQVGTRNVTLTSGTAAIGSQSVPIYRNVVVPLASRYNGILITDNDSPRPVDRIYFGYNYYNNIGTTWNSGFERLDMHRQTLGFEKTFLDGNASFGMRLPFIQTTGGAPGIAQGNVGDLSLLLKYAFHNNLNTGDVASAGLVLTTPTGGGNDVILSDGTTPANSVIFQPWLGGVRMLPRGYAQGITSLLVPTDSRDPTLFNNSVALAYFLYQNANDRLVNAVIPFVEAHVRTPLNNSDPDSAIFFQNQMNLTFGTHFRTVRSTLSPAFCVPLVSPKPFSGEFNLMWNIRF
jgi:hypothetical protein